MDELKTIIDSANKLAKSEFLKYQTNKYYNTVPRELFKKLAEVGFTGLSIDQKYDGCYYSSTLTAKVLEELAKVDSGVSIFLSVHLMVAGLISKHGNEEQKNSFLPKLAKGELLGAFALTEAEAGSDASNLKTSAKKQGDNWILNGEKCYITSAGFADLYIVFAKSEASVESEEKNKICAFIVNATQEGIDVSPPEKKMGAELSPIASISFKNVVLKNSQLIGAENSGYKIALSGLAGGRINIAAIACGISSNAIEIAKNYMLERKQFGKKISEYQGLQFMIADMVIKLEASRQLTYLASKTLDENKSKKLNRIYPAYAKCFSSDSCMQITTDAVQLLGGAGYIKEYKVESLMRAAKMLQIVEGTNQIQRMLIAKEILSE
jgi:alkylation response protein AidB-like acyl-CoA dehydrogenase